MKAKITGIVTILTIFVALIFGGKIFETVESGHYQTKQAMYSGTMSAHMVPGTYLQMFGDITTWPVSRTFDFETEHEISTRFNDGSQSMILGTVRVNFPKSEQQALDLILEHGYKTELDLMEKLIFPHLGRVIRTSGNLMSAKQSFDELRADFDAWTEDQLTNGVYQTITEEKRVVDPMTGNKITKKFKIISKDKDGNVLRERNPIGGLGITFNAFRITKIKYSPIVEEQIEAQRQAIMEVETAKANAKKEEQNAKTIEMKGKASVMTAKYQKEEEKIKAVVDAEKNLEVQKLEKLAAIETKQKLIFLGEGEAERKKLVMQADGALAQKLEALVQINANYATAMKEYKGSWVPNIVMGDRKETQNGATALIDMLTAKTAKDLSLDMEVKANN